MPIDPEISLNIATPQFGAGANMGMIGQFAQVQNALNQNRLFQQTFAARQRAGQILSAAPSTEVGLQSLLQDPITAPFAGEVINSVRQGQLALAQTQKVQAETAQTQLGAAQSGLNAFLKALPAVAQDPSQWSGVVNANLATLPPDVARRVVPAMESIRKSLTDGLPEDPAAARAAFESRLGGFMVAGGVPHEAIRALYGTMAPHYEAVWPGGALGPVGGPMVPGGATGTPGGALGGGMPVGPSMTRQEEMKKVGAAGGDIANDMVNDAMELPAAIKRLDMMRDAMGQFQAGPGAEAKARIAEMLSALGASPGLIQGITKMTPGSLAATQLFEAEVKPFAINMLKQSAQGTGRVMRSEVDQFLGMLSAAKTPEALMNVLDQTRYGLQVGADRANQFTMFKQALAKGDPAVRGLDLADFPAWYNMRMRPQALPQQTGGGLQLGAQQRPAANPLAVPPGVTDLTPQIRQQHQQQLDKIWGQQ